MTLTLTHLDLEDSVNCTADSVLVLNGDTDNSPVIGRYCGTTLPLPITSSGRDMVVKFISNDQIQRHGFTASYSTSTTG